MRKVRCRQAGRISTGALLLAASVAVVIGCGAERFGGGGDAAAPGTNGSGGAGFSTGGDGAGSGTGGTGSGGAGTGGDSSGRVGTGGDGTGGAGSGGSGGVSVDAAPDLAPPPDARDAGDARDGATDAAACPNGTRDLSNVGTGDFHISFHVVTTQTGWVALVNQRSICNFGVFWDIRQTPTGAVSIETDNGTSAGYQRVDSTGAISDGQPHDVAVTRVGGTVSIRIDGAASGTGASSASLGALAALRTGTDVCDGSPNNPPTAAFAGMTLSDVCLTRP